MPVSPLVRLITLPTSGNVTIDVAEQNTLFVVTGNVTLTGNLTIQSSGTPFSALQVFIIYKAVVTVGAFTLTIFDEVFSEVQATVKQNITCTYHSGAWDVDTAPDASEDGWIETHMIRDEAVTNAKLADMTRGTVKVGDSTNRPSDLDGRTDGYVLIGDGNDIISESLAIAVSENIYAALIVKATTSDVLPAFTYNNGAGGIGATITINANGVAPAINGVTSTFGMRFLNKNSVDQRYNGIYQWTNLGSVGTQAVATRTTDSDQTSELDPQIVIATDGTNIDGANNNNANKPYTQQTDAPIIGTNVIVYLPGFVKSLSLPIYEIAFGTGTGITSSSKFTYNSSNDKLLLINEDGFPSFGIDSAGHNVLALKYNDSINSTIDQIGTPSASYILFGAQYDNGMGGVNLGVAQVLINGSTNVVPTYDLVTGFGITMGVATNNTAPYVARFLIKDSFVGLFGEGKSTALPLRFYESYSSGAYSPNFVAFKAADSLSANTTWTLPSTDSTGTQALVSNGSGVLSWATIGSGSVTSVSGTSNRITSTGGTTPQIDIASTYVGQTSITTLGTITTGTLSTGAIIGGVTMTLGSDATGDVYYRNSSGILTRLGVGSNGNVLTLAAGLPSWAAPSGGSGITIGTTAITSGTATRLLFEGAGNVVQESANLTFATSTLTIGVATSATGALALAGATSGTATLTVAAAAGTPTLTLPTTTDTLVGKATTDTFTNKTTTDERWTVITSSAGSATLDDTGTIWVFTGSTTTWTLPAVSGNTNRTFFIKNRGSGILTLQRAGSDNIYDLAAVTSILINPGEAYIINNDGTYWITM